MRFSLVWRSVFGLLVIGLAGCAGNEPQGPAPSLMGYPLLYSQDFETGVFTDWERTNPRSWRIERYEGNAVFSLFQRQTTFEPLFASPKSRAILDTLYVGDFILEAKIRTTAPNYAQRDLSLFFGYQSPSQFYYVHLSQEASENNHNIFIINNSDQAPIAFTRNDGVAWDQDEQWHTVRIVRTVATGRIDVFFDDMETPILQANSTIITEGRIGIGSFDDIGLFDDIYVWGDRITPPVSAAPTTP